MRSLIIRVSLGFFLFLPLTVFSAEITKCKGAACLIDLKGDSANVGDSFFAVNAEGKKKAIIVITKLKGEKAIGKIRKGSADVGMTLTPRAAKATADTSSPESEPVLPLQKKQSSKGRSNYGALFGFAMDSMTVDVTYSDGSSNTAELSGSAFSAKFLFDYRLFPQVYFRGTSGLESFVAAGSNVCTESKAAKCDVTIYYISFDAIGRYVFKDKGSFRPWAGGGFGLLFPATKESSALDSSSISNTSVMLAAGGFDWHMTSGMYLPVSIEYGMLPTSDDVKGNWIAVRAGMAWPF